MASVVQGERVKSVRAKLKDPSRDALEALVSTTKWTHPRTHTLSQELIKVRSSWAADSIENTEQRECGPSPRVSTREFRPVGVRIHLAMLLVQARVHDLGSARVLHAQSCA